MSSLGLDGGLLAVIERARVLWSVLFSLIVIAILVSLLGADPIVAAEALIQGSVGSPASLGQTVMLGSVLSLTALAALIPFTARMWNVGGEGQLYVGAVAACAIAFSFEGIPGWLAVVLLLIAGSVAGALWGAIPGVLKAMAGANEVITSLMLQFVAALLAVYASTTIWPSGIDVSTRELPDSALLPVLDSASGITLGAPIAVVVVAAGWVLMFRSSLGFQVRAVGFNARAAALNGIAVKRIQISSFVIGGACAGLAGAILVAGIYGALISGSAAGFGFLGIAVALVARLSPARVIPTAFVFAALHAGGNSLEVEAGISSAVGEVLVGVIVVMMLAFGVVRLRYPEAAE